jgi:hypothetical protein
LWIVKGNGKYQRISSMTDDRRILSFISRTMV